MFTSKGKNMQIEKSVRAILNAYDGEVVIARNDGCSVLSMNEAVVKKLGSEELSMTNCRTGYSCIFLGLCDYCNSKSQDVAKPLKFETRDADGRVFSVTRNFIEWIDGKEATVFVLHDVDDEWKVKQEMYNLAFTDHLTGIPNRQKLAVDFEAMEEEIAEGKVCGTLAMFDLDNFKVINDTYGHNTGDAMLRLLTEHFEGEKDFKGHLYRLGGDEFVLLYKENIGRFKTQTDLSNYYQEIFQKALLSYTMPKIVDSCTLSLGAAYFPAHGSTLSELLRKSDIALYKAKEAGRNQIKLFEEGYDSAKKFKDLYINIQPILTREGVTFGYEMVDSEKDNKDSDGTVSLSEFDRTLDTLGLNEIKDNTKYFIEFTKQLFHKTTLKNLPRDKFIIQISASDKYTDERMLLYKHLRDQGFSLSIHGIDSNNLNENLLYLADYCSFADKGIASNEQARLIYENPKKTFIATNVSTNDDFFIAQRQGFKLFQGYFFSQPVVTKREKDIEPLKANYFHLLQLTSTDDYVDFNVISAIIASDVALSYKLLRLLNSASVGLRTRVSSILMAVTFLGEENLKKWLAVLALRGITDEKPLELIRLSLIRAHFGEILAGYTKPKKDARHVFMMGLLSLLHVAMEKTKAELLEEIPVAEEISASLLSNEGPYSDILEFFQNYEYSNWDEITRFCQKYGLAAETVSNAYIQSVKWCNNLIEDCGR